MAELETKTLLICQGRDCEARFVSTVDASLQGDAASLPAALEAHKAGWLVADGQILCPECGLKQNLRSLH